MAIEVRPHDTRTLLGFYRDVEAPVNYFRNLLTSGTVTFDTEYLDFEKITENCKLAPLVVPTSQGRPIFTEQPVRLSRLKPAYVKPKDAVSPDRVIKKRPGEDMFAPATMTPYMRFLSLIGDILKEHRNSIDNRIEWLVSQAAIYGKVTLSGPDYPERTVDFERDPSHTITLSTDLWSDPDAPILDMIQEWKSKIRRADFGGPVTRVTVGRDVAGYLNKNKQIIAERDLQVRGTDVQRTSLFRNDDYAEKILTAGGLEFWTTSDWYTAPDGTVKTYMPSNGVLLTGPNLNMVECYGAIQDLKAKLQALPVFVKQWDQEDPSGTFLMSQSAPLAVPVNPNNSLFATVL